MILAYALHQPNFLYIIVAILLAALALWANKELIEDAFLNKLIRVAVIVIVVLAIIFSLVGCSKDATANKELYSAVGSQLLRVAQAEAQTLAQAYLSGGAIDYKKALISGALSQVYTLETKQPTPLTERTVSAVVGNVITDPKMKQSVTDAALTTIAAVPQGTAINTGISKGIIVLNQEVEKVAGTL